MPAITVSASYGAGGSVVAPQVAAALGWELVDRALSSAVAERLAVPVEDAEQGGRHSSAWERFLYGLAPLAPQPLAVDSSPDEAATVEVRTASERLMHDAVARGAVVLGRGGACALAADPGVLRVRLYGAPDARVRQAVGVEGVDLATATRRQPVVDRAREAYVRRLYGRSADDPSLYHLQVDSTLLPLPACADLVLQAYRALTA